ncbi:CPBP family intramembrane metalloprotease [Candidatus Dojkabacteria bacterium]|nr:CPBP family intramembrane metalloprotease [Candidatus Dojkabacteria bacterium]
MSKSLIADLVDFLRLPSPEKAAEPITLKIWRFVRVFALQYALTIILGVIVVLTLSLFSYSLDDHAVGKLFDETSLPMFIFFSVVFAPVFEEASFRLFLRYSALGLSISVPFVILSILSLVGFYNLPFVPDWLFSVVSFKGLLSFLGFLIAVAVISYLTLTKTTLGKRLEKFYSRFYGVLLYSSILLFGLVHLTNFDNLSSVWYLAPIIILPQLVVGIALSYIRVRQGFLWGVLFHSLHNLVSTIPAILYTFHTFHYQLVDEMKLSNEILQNATVSTTDLIVSAVTLGYVGIGISLLVIVNIFTVAEYFIQFFKNKKK